MTTPVIYKGYKIIVEAGQQSQGKWVGNYTVIVMGRSDMRSTERHYLRGTFNSEKAAEVGAEHAARRWIDQNPL